MQIVMLAHPYTKSQARDKGCIGTAESETSRQAVSAMLLKLSVSDVFALPECLYIFESGGDSPARIRTGVHGARGRDP